MSVSYIERYSIPGVINSAGIEDYEDGRPDEEHFFASNYRERKCLRFKLWWGGCGAGEAPSLEQARSMLHSLALSRAQDRRRLAQIELDTLKATEVRLFGPAILLQAFKVKEST